MGVTLDELLDESGISSMNAEHEKLASEDTRDGLDIVDQLRKLAEDDSASLRDGAERELIEKTAEILVIKETIGEINNLSSIGIDNRDQSKIASFISSAIDSGHSEEEIAFFLEKNAGIVSRAARGIGRVVQKSRRKSIPGINSAVYRAEQKGLQITGNEKRLLRRTFLEGDEKEILKHLNDVESHYGPKGLQSFLIEMKDEGTRLPSAAFRKIPRDKITPSYSVEVNGKLHGISKARAHQGGLVGAGLGTGYAVTRKGDSKNGSGRNVTIVS